MLFEIVEPTFGLTVLAQEGWIADDAVEGRFHLRWQLDRLLEVVVYELLEDPKAFVYLKKFDLWSALVLS